MATKKKGARAPRTTTRKSTKRKKRTKSLGRATTTRSRARDSGRTATTRRSTGAIRDASIDVLRDEIKRRIDTLEKRRQELLTELDSVESEIAVAAGSLGGNGYVRPRSASRGRTRRRPRNELNLVESLQKVLKSTTMSVTEMAGAVQRAGYKTTSPNFRTIVNQTLIKNPKLFKRVSRGRYTAK